MSCSERDREKGSRLAAFFLAAVVLALAGCAGLRPLVSPADGGSPWVVVTSAHFTVRTDLPPDVAGAMTAELEALHAALKTVIPGPPSSEGLGDASTEIVWFERALDFDAVADKRAAVGLFSQRESGPQIVLQGSNLPDESRERVLHELTHRLLHERFGPMPTWFNEGLAQYYSTLAVDGNSIVLGKRLPGMDFSQLPYFWYSWYGSVQQLQVPAFKAPPMSELVRSDSTAFYVSTGDPAATSERAVAHYVASWRLVHLFLNGPDARYRARFRVFQDMVQQRRDADVAFEDAFDGIPAEELEAAYRQYLTELPLSLVELPFSPPAAAVPEVRPLSDQEVRSLWTRLKDDLQHT
jgi:hypothetical protein